MKKKYWRKFMGSLCEWGLCGILTFHSEICILITLLFLIAFLQCAVNAILPCIKFFAQRRYYLATFLFYNPVTPIGVGGSAVY